MILLMARKHHTDVFRRQAPLRGYRLPTSKIAGER